MKRLIQICLFFVLPISVILLLLFTFSSTQNSWYVPVLPSHKTTLIVGNSHPECAIIERMEDPYINLGKSGECFYYSVRKAEWLLNSNPQIKQVWIEMAPNQFMPHMAQWINDSEYQQRALLSFPFLMDSQWELATWKKDPVASLQTKLVQMRRFWSAVIAPDWETDRSVLKWGMYRELNGRSAKFTNPEEEGGQVIQPDRDNWMALENFCKNLEKRGVQVFAFQCPEYRKLDNFGSIQAYCKSQRLPIKHYLEIEFDVNDSTLFYDASHLNQKGAKQFSQQFRELLSH